MGEATSPEDSPARAVPADRTERRSPAGNLLSLALDVGVPVGSYYLFSKGVGLSTTASLALASVLPAIRTGWSVFVRRRTNAFSVAVLTVTLVGLALSLWTGDARLLLAKDSGATGALSVAVLVSALRGTPLMSAALKPWLVRGDPERDAAWRRLSADSAGFRSAERRYSLVWGGALLAECVARVIGAYTLPVTVMVWLSTVFLAVSVVVAVVVSSLVATRPMERMIAAAATARTAPSEGTRPLTDN